MGDGMSEGVERASTALIAVDTGGTFTDLLCLRDGGLELLKLPSTPHDPAEAVLQGILKLAGGRPFELVHGSTVATNTLLERKGARVALLTNRGLEDVIEIARQNRPQLYALVGQRDDPLVSRGDRIGISGRLSAEGEELEPLDPVELGGLSERLSALGAEAVAIVLLHSYLSPEHEHEVARALAECPLPLSVSSAVLPEFREYERTSTTVVNAYVQPRMERYLRRIDAESGAERVRIMASGGGSLTVEAAAREPVHTVVSGPAGGVVGAARWARAAGFEHAITFDMGGTSTDVAIVPGRLLTTRECSIGGQPVATPVLDIHTVGAGGGSIARMDAGGALRVGPESAGAVPGPICYGKGGREITVTDAHVWLGRIPEDAFLGGGGTPLSRSAIREPLRALASSLGTDPEGAAEGVLEVADVAMERAIRVISVERGYDPREFVLVAFGGAGALHAASLASRVGTGRVLVPPHTGLLSAWGMLVAPIRRDASRTVLISSEDPSAPERIREALDELAGEARERIAEAGPNPDEVSISELVDARYRGQSFEIEVPATGWIDRFHIEHESRYGYARPDAPVEAVTVRAVATAAGAEVHPHRLPPGRAEFSTSVHPIVLHGVAMECTRVDRSALPADATLSGPAVVAGYGSTTWVPPGWKLRTDEWGCLHLEAEA